MLGTPLAIRLFSRRRLRPDDPRGGPVGPPRQARHAHHGRHRVRASPRCSATPSPTWPRRTRADRLRAAGAVPDDRASAPSASSTTSSRSSSSAASACAAAPRCSAAHHRRGLRGAGDPAVPQRLRHHPGRDPPVVPARLRPVDRPVRVRDLGAHHDRRLLQRGEPHRRPRRPGQRRHRRGARRLRADRQLAAAQQLHRRSSAPTATGCATRSTWPWSPPPCSARWSASCGGTPRPPRSSWATPGSLGPRRRAGRPGHHHPHPAAAHHPGRAVRDHHAVGDHPGRASSR